MSWATEKATVTDVLDTYQYRELEYNLNQEDEAPFTYSHKSYTLRPIRNQMNSLVNNKYVGSSLMELKIGYTATDRAIYDANYELWLEILGAIAQYTKGFASEPEYVRDSEDSNLAYGTAQFYIGENQC